MLKVLLTALLITVIFGIVMRMSPSLSARAKTLLRHSLARTITFQVVLRLIAFSFLGGDTRMFSYPWKHVSDQL